jgi:hypothetical protein
LSRGFFSGDFFFFGVSGLCKKVLWEWMPCVCLERGVTLFDTGVIGLDRGVVGLEGGLLTGVRFAGTSGAVTLGSIVWTETLCIILGV